MRTRRPIIKDVPRHTGVSQARGSAVDLWICLVLAAATFAVYAQVRQFEFVNYDDPDYVTGNVHVQQGLTASAVQWAFSSRDAANWFPVTRLSHLVDVQLFGMDSGMHHLVNVAIHAATALLLFLFLNRATRARWPSAFVAFVFALHPLHVESVAWIAERKDVLSAFFCFLSLWLYVRYTEQPDWRRYVLVAAAFALGLMAKPTIVTLPFLLLLLDFWPLRRGSLRVRALLKEKIPFFAMAAASSTVTYAAQQSSRAIKTFSVFPLELRIENALVSYVVYGVKTFWPVKLAVFYPYPRNIPAWEAAVAGLMLIGITVGVLRAWRRYPFLAVGWLWYLGMLVPVIGIVQVGAQARADRYTYLPMTGLLIMVAWSAAEA
ncbi:MAG: glycosyltransferase family 39 protein, partial [Acidobacteriaceae bacterium]|nr:glycosyltransferase family 39 protein [Acidobacteriaceae bacterium]